MTYCIDTSALITAWGEMYPIENFPPIWDNFQQLIDDGKLLAPIEVWHETKRRSGDLHAWLGKRKKMFVDIDDPIQRRQAAIMAAYPKLIDQRKGHFAADPWVIAVAIERGLHLVTLERLTGKANRPNIPDVCADAAFKAPCINLLDLIRREKWVLKWARNRFCILAKPPQGEEHHGRGRGIPVEHLREENPMRHKR